MGARPTHPELLDYLASYFVDNGWSMKKVHRLILLSNAYQEASDFDAKIAEADPDNKLLWRYPRHRMEAEAIRDSMLATSGLLNPQMGGPGVYPPVPPGLISELSATAVAGGWRTEKDPAQSDRRSVYIFVRRNLPYPLLQEFDAANTFESCDYRKNTVTAPQSLDLLNNELVLDWARSLAGTRFQRQRAHARARKWIGHFVWRMDARPAPKNRRSPKIFSRSRRPSWPRGWLAPSNDAKPPVPANLPQGTDQARAAAFVDLCHMLMDSNEFLYIN